MPEKLRSFGILVVDDNSTNRKILQEMLSAWEMRPVFAASGPEALQILADAAQSAAPIQLLLLDYMMPEMDGAEVCRQVRQRYGSKGPKILILTSGGAFSSQMSGETLGYERCLSKPLKHSELFDAISRALGGLMADDKTLVAPAVPQRRDTRPLNLLLVEDGRVNQLVAIKLLEDRGHHVTLANNGREALTILSSHAFDVILMDIQMPEMNGIEATAAIRQGELGSGKHVPIIAMTANAMKGDREQFLDAGMDDYISKPIYSAKLQALLEKYAGPPTPALVEPPLYHVDPDAPAFDAAEFRANLDDVPLMRELIVLYLADSQAMLGNACLALHDADAEALHHAAHSLKGLVGNYAAAPALDAISALTDCTQAGNLVHASKLLAVVTEELARLREALLQFQQELDAESA